ncbi:unnamed protein product, partial [Meganyctiphanes norvegica]
MAASGRLRQSGTNVTNFVMIMADTAIYYMAGLRKCKWIDIKRLSRRLRAWGGGGAKTTLTNGATETTTLLKTKQTPSDQYKSTPPVARLKSPIPLFTSLSSQPLLKTLNKPHPITDNHWATQQKKYIMNRGGQNKQSNIILKIVVSEGIFLGNNLQVHFPLQKNVVQSWTHCNVQLPHANNPHWQTGALMRAESFMTWQRSIHSMLVTMLRNINDGRLCLLIGVPEFTTFLNDGAMGAIQALGSSFIDKVTLRDAWFMVIRKGMGSLHEAIVTSKQHKRNNTFKDVSPITAHVTVHKTSEGVECNWHTTAGMEQRAAFCNSYGGYGSLCRCHQPWMPKPGKVLYEMREKIPIALATAKRLPNVLRLVDEIWSSPGGGETPIAIYVDRFNREAQELGDILHIPIFFHQHTSSNGPLSDIPVNVNIAQHMAFTLEHVFLQFPEVDKAIILEDDLQLAPDFIPFFQQTASLLDDDPHLLCVNAYNLNAFPHTSYDPSRLYRVHSVPAYGWMVRRTWANKMLDHWPNATQDVDWDLYLRNSENGLPGNWDIIIPEVPRTKHRGGGGSHSSGLVQERFFNQQTLNMKVNVTMDIESSAVSDSQLYFHHHMNIIDSAKVLNITQHPCEVNPLPTYKTNESYVIYINQTTESDKCSTYFVLAACFGINEMDSRENLQLMFTFPFYGNQVYLIACPNSPFCLPSVIILCTSLPASTHHSVTILP